MNASNVDRVSSLLEKLGERPADRGVEGEIYVPGGASGMLVYDRIRITKDMDLVGVPQDEIDAEVRAMAADH